MKGLKVTCVLSSPVAGDLPMLDALIEFRMAQQLGVAYKPRRDAPAPEFGKYHSPILRRRFGGMAIPCCSSPISDASSRLHERFAKRLSVEYADMLSPKQRKIIATTNGVYKSYFLPLNIQPISRIVWFVVARRRPMLQLLRSVHSIGRKRSQGYGRVAKWEAERINEDWSWFAPHPDGGTLLMRPLPVCDELPEDLIGYKPDFGAVQPPYWHPERYIERVVPC